MVTETSPSLAPEKTGPEFHNLNGRPVVILDQADYERLQEKASKWELLLKEPDANHTVEGFRAALARKILRHRRQLGLTQVAFARRAGIRPETLNRLENRKHTPSMATVEKIERALKEVES